MREITDGELARIKELFDMVLVENDRQLDKWGGSSTAPRLSG